MSVECRGGVFLLAPWYGLEKVKLEIALVVLNFLVDLFQCLWLALLSTSLLFNCFRAGVLSGYCPSSLVLINLYSCFL